MVNRRGMKSCPGKSPPNRKYETYVPDDRDRQDDAGGDAQTGTGQQVVRQRVAREALEQAQHHQREADEPVDLTGLAERTGEEDPQHVDHDRHQEDQGRPVVHLAHQQSGAHVEADVQRRGEGLGHRDAVERVVRAVVLDLAHARVEPQRQEDAGEQDQDEREQRDLAEQEAPVVREDLPEQVLRAPQMPEPLVRPVGDRSVLHGRGRPRPRRAGAVVALIRAPRSSGRPAARKSLTATRLPSASTVIGSCGSDRAAGPKMTLPSSDRSKVDWWHGHSMWCVCCSYSATGQPTWVQILENAMTPSTDQSHASSSAPRSPSGPPAAAGRPAPRTWPGCRSGPRAVGQGGRVRPAPACRP